MARPLKHKDPAKVAESIEAYFADCDNRGAGYTLIGLANALDIDRATLYRYRNPKTLEKDDLSDFEQITEKTKSELCIIVTRAVAKIEQYTAERLYDKDAYKGAQFLLATNYGYRQTQTLELQADKDISISISD